MAFLRWIPKKVRKVLLCIILAGVCLFIFVEIQVIRGFGQTGEPGLSHIIVLGAQVKTDGPSLTLKLRLDKAFEYLQENKDTIVVVSGGKGSDEPVAEAEAMKNYLVEKGISEDRIIKEDRSVNTSENLAFSRELIDEKVKNPGIVTTNFHIFRSVSIAKKAGFDEAQGIAAEAYRPALAYSMVREFFGTLKDFVMGNM